MASVAEDTVAAVATGGSVVTSAAGKPNVGPIAARQAVVARPAPGAVTPAAPRDRIVAAATPNVIATAKSVHRVVSGESMNPITTGRGVQDVVTRRTANHFRERDRGADEHDKRSRKSQD
jgi:hypothetical protein